MLLGQLGRAGLGQEARAPGNSSQVPSAVQGPLKAGSQLGKAREQLLGHSAGSAQPRPGTAALALWAAPNLRQPSWALRLNKAPPDTRTPNLTELTSHNSDNTHVCLARCGQLQPMPRSLGGLSPFTEPQRPQGRTWYLHDAPGDGLQVQRPRCLPSPQSLPAALCRLES